MNGSSSFEFNGDRYAVFDSEGRPRPPQVCIDFVLDTFERASGTWWQSRSQGRQRVLGRLQFDDAALENRRSVERFIDFARAHAESFDVYEPAPEARVPLRNRALASAELYRSRDEFQSGDIVAILGPREDEKLHYHSFFIVDADPLSGMPTELAANAGRPRIRSWEGEMQNAPRRSILARIRPRPIWLDALVGPENGVSADDPQGTSWWGRHAPPPSAEVNSAEPPPTRRRCTTPIRELRWPSKPCVALERIGSEQIGVLMRQGDFGQATRLVRILPAGHAQRVREQLTRDDGAYSPVEQAIRHALA